MNKENPTWHQDAIDLGIDYVIVVYTKAEGFVFCPSNLERPFRVGGDYGGNFPTDAVGALGHFNGYFNQAYNDDVRWFIEFVQMIIDGRDFSLSDLKIEQRQLKIIKGRWPW